MADDSTLSIKSEDAGFQQVSRSGRVRKKSVKLREMEGVSPNLETTKQPRKKSPREIPAVPATKSRPINGGTVKNLLKTSGSSQKNIPDPLLTNQSLGSFVAAPDTPKKAKDKVPSAQVSSRPPDVPLSPDDMGVAGTSGNLKIKLCISGKGTSAQLLGEETDTGSSEEDMMSDSEYSMSSMDDLDEMVEVEEADSDHPHHPSSSQLLNVLSSAPGPSSSSSGGDLLQGEDSMSPPVYSNAQEMALKVKTSSERKAARIKKTKGQQDLPPTLTKSGRLKSRRPTAYTMFCREYREKVFAENPSIPASDFAQISKRLGEIWQTIPEKEKLAFRRKARQYAGRLKRAAASGAIPLGSKHMSHHLRSGVRALVSSGQAPDFLSAKISSKLAAKFRSHRSPSEDSTDASEPPVSKTGRQMVKTPTSPEETQFTTEYEVLENIEPIDIAAHMKLLGDSLSVIGSNLQNQARAPAVQGALSVLLDTMLCSLGPLMALTTCVPELNGCPLQTHSKTLDNISYIMPGL